MIEADRHGTHPGIPETPVSADTREAHLVAQVALSQRTSSAVPTHGERSINKENRCDHRACVNTTHHTQTPLPVVWLHYRDVVIVAAILAGVTLA
jgi:hypothetical protein